MESDVRGKPRLDPTLFRKENLVETFRKVHQGDKRRAGSFRRNISRSFIGYSSFSRHLVKSQQSQALVFFSNADQWRGIFTVRFFYESAFQQLQQLFLNIVFERFGDAIWQLHAGASDFLPSTLPSPDLYARACSKRRP